MCSSDKEIEKVLAKIRYDRQQKRKRLFEQAKRKQKQESEKSDGQKH